MKRMLVVGLLVLGAAVAGRGQDGLVRAKAVETFKAGGTPIALPVPCPEMVEVGYDNREKMEVFVPQNNRLLAGFVLTSELSHLKEGSDAGLSRYAMVQVPRRGEYMDCGADDFKEVIAGAKEQFGEALNSTLKEAEEEVNRRLKAMDVADPNVKIETPVQLGCLFSKPDAYGFGMIMPITAEGKTTKMAMGGALVRVKERVLFVYLYSEYKNEGTVSWLRKTTESWVDSILKANR